MAISLRPHFEITPPPVYQTYFQMQRTKAQFTAEAVKLLPRLKSVQKPAIDAFQELCIAQFPSENPRCYCCAPVTLETAFAGGQVTINTIVNDKPAEFSVFINRGADTLDTYVCETDDNVVFVVVLEPHSVFTRDGDDLIINRTAMNNELIFGTAFSVTHLDGKKTILRTPALHYIPPDAHYLARGLGMPKRDNLDERGDIHVNIGYGVLTLSAGLIWEVAGFMRTCWNRTYQDSVLLELVGSGQQPEPAATDLQV